MADETFVQSVKIEGLSELVAALAKLGEVGEKAFRQIGEGATAATKPLSDVDKAAKAASDRIAEIEKSAHAFGSSLRNVGSAVSNVADAMQGMITRTGLLAAAVTGAAGAFGVFLTRTIDSIDAIKEQSEALGLSTKSFQEYKAAALAGGSTAKQFATGFQNVNKLITDGIREQDQALLNLGDRIEASQKKFAGVIRIPPSLSRDLAKENALIEEKVASIAEKLQRPAFEVRNALRAMAGGTAESRKELEKFGIILPSLTPNLDKLRAGAEKGGNALSRLGVQLRDAKTGEARKFEDVIKDIADKLGKIENPAERAAKGMEIFRSAALANTFGKSAEETEKFLKAIQDLGIGLDDNVINAASEAQSKLDLLGLALTSVKQRFAAAFAGPLTLGAAGLTKVISENQAALDELGKRLADFILPVLKDFLLILSGKGSEAVNTTWVRNFTTGLEHLYTVIKDKVIFAFNLLLTISNGVAKVINTIFGTELKGGMVAALVAVTALTGGFRVLFTLIVAGFRIFQTLSAAFTTLALAAGTGGAAGAVGLLATQFARFFIPAAVITGLIALNTNFDIIIKKCGEVATAIKGLFGNVSLDGIDVFRIAVLGAAAALVVLAARVPAVRTALLTLIPGPILTALGVLAALINDVSNSADRLPKSKEHIADLFTVHEAAKRGAFKSMDEYQKALDAVAKKYGSTAAAGTASGETQKAAAKSVAEEWKEAAAGTGASLGKLETKAATTAKKVESSFRKTSDNVWDKFDENGNRVLGNFEQKVPGVIQRVGEKSTKSLDAIGKSAEEVTKKIEGGPAEGVDALLARLRKLNEEGSKDVTSLSGAFQNFVATGLKNAEENLKAIEDRINSILQKLPSIQNPNIQTPSISDTGDVMRGGGITHGTLEGGQGTDPTAAGTLQTQASTAGMNALTTATNAARAALESFKQFVVQVNDCLALLAQNVITTDKNFRVMQEETQKTGEALNTAKTSVTGFSEALNGIKTAMDSLDLTTKFESVAKAVGDAVGTITQKFQELITGVEQAATSMANAVSSALDTVIQKLDTAIAKAKELAAAQASSGGGGGGSSGPGMVTGGIARGPGGIDNVPAWLTRGEWVINKESSRRYHGILRAINDGTFRMPKFNMGGLVSGALSSLTPASPRLAFAGGGEVDSGPMTRIELALPGGRVVQVQGRRSAVNEINDFALRRKAASAGRHPRGG